jgi:hypothetical protein
MDKQQAEALRESFSKTEKEFLKTIPPHQFVPPPLPPVLKPKHSPKTWLSGFYIYYK